MSEPSPRYEDFALEFAADEQDRDTYRVIIRAAPHPGPAGWFRLPFPREGLNEVLAGIERQVLAGGVSRNILSPEPEQPVLTLEEVGNQLFESLFQGVVRDSFLQSRERVKNVPGTGLRLRLVMYPESTGGSLLATLPWELLYRRETRDYLSRNLWTPVVRFLVTPEAPGPASLGEGLRIVVASANPKGSARLALDREAGRFKRAWSEQGIAVEYLRDASAESLSRAVRQQQPHVLHFMGHGTFDDRNGEGGLLLESAAQESQLATVSVLADMVKTAPPLRLVCLNACDTGRLPRTKGQDPFSRLASALVLAGVPAVIAMQFPISDGGALAFSGALYSALASGDPVDAAVTEGRMAIHRRDARSWEWATPALYLSTATGELFAHAHEKEPARYTQKLWIDGCE